MTDNLEVWAREGRRDMDLTSGQIQQLVPHADVRATMINTHVLNEGSSGVRSPVDALDEGSQMGLIRTEAKEPAFYAYTSDYCYATKRGGS